MSDDERVNNCVNCAHRGEWNCAPDFCSSEGDAYALCANCNFTKPDVEAGRKQIVASRDGEYVAAYHTLAGQDCFTPIVDCPAHEKVYSARQQREVRCTSIVLADAYCEVCGKHTGPTPEGLHNECCDTKMIAMSDAMRTELLRQLFAGEILP